MIVNPYQVESLPLRLITALDQGILGPHFPGVYERIIIPVRQKLYEMSLSRRVNEELSRMVEGGRVPLFKNIKLETINRCNGTCSFCPVSIKHEKRPFMLMDRGLFESIVRQLEELDYSGLISMYINNEPLLDGRVYEFCRMARRSVPRAFIYMFTNGTLLNVERLEDLMSSLDGMIINNYDDEQKIRGNMVEVARHAEEDPVLREKVFIYLRKKNEIRNNRGGIAPNRRSIIPLASLCMMPFKQMAVRPDGMLSLCCTDAYGDVTLGDLNNESIVEAWYGEKYTELRKRMLAGRGKIPRCAACDLLTTLMEGEAPHPLMRPHEGSIIRIN